MNIYLIDRNVSVMNAIKSEFNRYGGNRNHIYFINDTLINMISNLDKIKVDENSQFDKIDAIVLIGTQTNSFNHPFYETLNTLTDKELTKKIDKKIETRFDNILPIYYPISIDMSDIKYTEGNEVKFPITIPNVIYCARAYNTDPPITDYVSVCMAMRSILLYAKKEGFNNVLIPGIGSGASGGNPELVAKYMAIGYELAMVTDCIPHDEYIKTLSGVLNIQYMIPNSLVDCIDHYISIDKQSDWKEVDDTSIISDEPTDETMEDTPIDIDETKEGSV